MPRAIPTLLCCALLAVAPSLALAKGALPEPDEGPDPRGLTLSGAGLAYVNAPARPSEATIEHAITAVKPKALARAIEQARGRAQALAGAAGLTLGEIRAVTELEPGAEFDFGPSRHCARRCRVPLFALATVTVTFATTQTSAAVPAERAIIATGTARAPVTPVNRHSSASIRQSLLVARLAAAPGALSAARSDGEATARAMGIAPGALFSIAEVRRPFDDFPTSFGPGRYCGTVRLPIFRRDPATGRPRVVRRVTRRQCHHPNDARVALRVTWLPG